MISTAEEILIKEEILLKTIEESGNFPLNLTRDTHIGTAKNIKKAMIEFAKLHVEASLKKASEKAVTDYEYAGETGEFDDISVYDYFVDKKSILNAYSLENVK